MRGPYKRAALYERVNALFGPISVLFITKTFLLEFFPGVYFCDLHRNGITKAMMGMGWDGAMEWSARAACGVQPPVAHCVLQSTMRQRARAVPRRCHASYVRRV